MPVVHNGNAHLCVCKRGREGEGVRAGVCTSVAPGFFPLVSAQPPPPLPSRICMSLIPDDVQAPGAVCDGEDVCVCQAEVIGRQDSGPSILLTIYRPACWPRRQGWCRAQHHKGSQISGFRFRSPGNLGIIARPREIKTLLLIYTISPRRLDNSVKAPSQAYITRRIV